MPHYRFSVIVPAPEMGHERILDATDALGESGCTDASICGHAEGIEVLFDRSVDSLQAAISSAIRDVEGAGFRVSRVELEREAIDDTKRNRLYRSPPQLDIALVKRGEAAEETAPAQQGDEESTNQ